MTKAILVKAFTSNPDKGNPAGVILDSHTLSEEQMQIIAKKLNFSESVFISNNKNKIRFRFFSPTQEVDICVHAMIAGVYILDKKFQKNIWNIQTNIGTIEIQKENDRFSMTQKTPIFGEVEKDIDKISRLLNIKNKKIGNFPIQTVSTGTPKLMIPVDGLKTLFDIKPDLEGIKAYCKKNGCRGFYPFCFETIKKSSDIHARQFNPLAGINEDPITGIAAGALGAYLQKYKILNKNEFIIEQGYIMNRMGIIYVDISSDIKISGNAISYGEIEF